MSFLDDPNLQAARTQSQGAQSAYGAAAAAAHTLPDMLKESLSKKLGTNNPVVAAREAGLQKYFDVAGAAPLSVTNTSAGGTSPYIFNPAQQQSLMTSQRGAALAPVSSANALFGLEVGGLDDIIGSTGRAYQGQLAGLQNNATMARQNYLDLFGDAQIRAEEESAQIAAEEEARRWGLNYELDKYKAYKPSGGGSGYLLSPEMQKEWLDRQFPKTNQLPKDFTPDDYQMTTNQPLDWQKAIQSGGLSF